MKKTFVHYAVMFGFFAQLTRAFVSPINCAGEYGQRLIGDTTQFVTCVLGNLAGSVDQVNTNPDVL